MAILTEDQMQYAARRLASGTSRMTLLDEFYDEMEANGTLPDEPRSDTRRKISNELAYATPGNPRFAETKYGELVRVEQSAIQELFTEAFIDERDNFVDYLKEHLATLRETMAKLNEQCQLYLESPDATPTTPQEYAALQNTALRIAEERRKSTLIYLKMAQLWGDPGLTRDIEK